MNESSFYACEISYPYPHCHNLAKGKRKMGQALKKFVPGQLSIPTDGAIAMSFLRAPNQLARLFSDLSTEIGDLITEDRSEDNKAREIGPIIDKCYNKHFGDTSKDWNSVHVCPADFYRAVCETVEEINRKFGNTQFFVPKATRLEQAYDNHHESKGRPMTREEFQTIFQDVIMDTGFTGGGAKDTLFYIFGVPLAALMIKQKAIPKAISNDIFIPCVTSATVFILAKLNKL